MLLSLLSARITVHAFESNTSINRISQTFVKFRFPSLPLDKAECRSCVRQSQSRRTELFEQRINSLWKRRKWTFVETKRRGAERELEWAPARRPSDRLKQRKRGKKKRERNKLRRIAFGAADSRRAAQTPPSNAERAGEGQRTHRPTD